MSKVFSWDKIPAAHQMMWKNQHPPGNMAVLVSAPRPGCRTIEDLHVNAQFMEISAAGMRESHVHDVQIVKEAPNYRVE